MLSFVRRLFSGQRAQVLPIMALLAIVFVGLLGLAIDMARLFVARTELSRALDSAALAGVVELPNTDFAQQKATTYLHENLPEASATFPATGEPFQIRVKGTRTVDMVFMDIFGFGEVDVSATATAGFGVVPLDVVMAIDATGSMGASPCNSSHNNSGCPIHEAKIAAKNFTDLLLGSLGANLTQVGATAYRGCFNPPRSNSSCVPGSWKIGLSGSASSIKTSIDSFDSLGGTGTNNCLALNESDNILFGTGASTEANTLRFVVILTDGDNTWNTSSYGNGEPPSACRPSNPSSSQGYTGTDCQNTESQEAEMDVDFRDRATTLKASGVEIYVVGLGSCGSANTNLCNTGMIGSTSYHDNTADRNLLKCVASSTSGTNDHYFTAETATELPSVFEEIAQNIAFRLIE
jgi:hypothetical protein